MNYCEGSHIYNMCRTSTTWPFMSQNHSTQCKERDEKKNLPIVHYPSPFFKSHGNVESRTEVTFSVAPAMPIYLPHTLKSVFAQLPVHVCAVGLICCKCFDQGTECLSASSPRPVPSTRGVGPAAASPRRPHSSGILAHALCSVTPISAPKCSLDPVDKTSFLIP